MASRRRHQDMDSEDSRDASGDGRSSSSSSSSSRSRRSSSSENSKKGPKSPQSPRSNGHGPRSPSPESHSQSTHRSSKQPQSPDNLSGAHSDINSPENSLPGSPLGPKSPDAPKSPSEAGSNVGSPKRPSSPPPLSGPRTPQSPSSSLKSPVSRSQPVSPDSGSQIASPQCDTGPRSQTSSPSPDQGSSQSSPLRSPVKKNDWSPKDKWRRHTKAEQKMVATSRARSRSESSQSSRSSSYNKRSTKDPATEEISDGEMESDQDDRKSRSKSIASDKNEGKDISHEDLSDVSDLDSESGDIGEKSKMKSKPKSPPLNHAGVNGNVESNTRNSPKSDNARIENSKLDKLPQEKTSNTEDGEEQLDFEAEEGECIEPKQKDHSNGDIDTQTNENEETKAGRRSRGSSLEEGEVSDEAERRPEESEPRPVCRFFSRGACTWGVSCRFLHPGVTDKGNYNMFDVVRGVPAGAYVPRETAPPESAWERGLRTAKEMLRIANKRKEQDMDFEEKKLHLSVGGAAHDPDAELAYAAAAVGASPPTIDAPAPRDPEVFSRPYGVMYRGRFPRPVDERERYYERERGYERGFERPPPPYYDEHAPPEDMAYNKRRVRSSREVIVQRAEVERREGREGREREGRGREGREGRERGDEWADPWMRTEPSRRRRPPSSEDSYSSSSSSHSSSRSSGSPGARRKRRASPSSRQRLSPSVIVRERRLATARATAMNPPAPRRRAPSPAARQLAVNPSPPVTAAAYRHKEEIDPYGRSKAVSRNRNRKKYSRSSSSGSESSSSSSESESESHSSSSSGSSGARRARHARLLNAAARPIRLNAKPSLGGPTGVANKKESSMEKEIISRKRSATSPVGGAAAKKSVSRREELLKQLKAVEDAIARKRSKI